MLQIVVSQLLTLRELNFQIFKLRTLKLGFLINVFESYEIDSNEKVMKYCSRKYWNITYRRFFLKRKRLFYMLELLMASLNAIYKKKLLKLSRTQEHSQIPKFKQPIIQISFRRFIQVANFLHSN
jgi:hypothetical protein